MSAYYYSHRFMRTKNNQKGFTLLEVLLVIAIIIILAGIVIVALNIPKQLASARNAERQAEVNALLNAVYQYSLDHNGALPGAILATETEICLSQTNDCSGMVDLSVLTAQEEYLVAIPTDPKASTPNGSGYTIRQTPGGRIQVSAPLAEYGNTISVSR